MSADTPLPPQTPSVILSAVRVPADANVPAGAAAAELIRVVDGDTIHVLLNGQDETIRYVGVDTPELGQPGYQAATEANRTLLGSGTLYLVRDKSERDRYGRLLRHVYRADGTFVDAEMVRQGWAQPVEYPPDTVHAVAFRQLSVEAAQAGRGFWSGTAPYYAFHRHHQTWTGERSPTDDSEFCHRIPIDSMETMTASGVKGNFTRMDDSSSRAGDPAELGRRIWLIFRRARWPAPDEPQPAARGPSPPGH